jgi:hypothetical protein
LLLRRRGAVTDFVDAPVVFSIHPTKRWLAHESVRLFRLASLFDFVTYSRLNVSCDLKTYPDPSVTFVSTKMAWWFRGAPRDSTRKTWYHMFYYLRRTKRDLDLYAVGSGKLWRRLPRNAGMEEQ